MCFVKHLCKKYYIPADKLIFQSDTKPIRSYITVGKFRNAKTHNCTIVVASSFEKTWKNRFANTDVLVLHFE